MGNPAGVRAKQREKRRKKEVLRLAGKATAGSGAKTKPAVASAKTARGG